MKKQSLFRWMIYLLGFVMLALGIISNTKSGLGASPIVSIPYTFSLMTGFNFGNASMIMYIVIAIIEYVVKGHHFHWYDLLQIPLAFFLTRLFNLFGSFIPNAQTLPMRLACLALGVICTGIGAAMSMNARLIPNPGDGIVQAIADRLNNNAGLVKNVFDITCVTISVIAGLMNSGHLLGVSIGTFVAMIGVGRVIAIYNKFFLKKTAVLSGIAND